jgi:hypothetical protein
MVFFVVNINSRHKALPSSVVFVVKAKLSKDSTINIRIDSWHYIKLKINVADMSNIERTELTTDSILLDFFILLLGFNLKEKALVTFIINRVFL